ncbi:hypothetical protein DM02DRAFT_677173 [Periconia macrospinosa]|uniref:Uncharacterized protein n=1 Tax=Periconia macrospinosa TaxID=97972 RepID=A0A2V1D4H8_9PLEO|nr:hypothetical protein DM02DRAFT_677173 [Periconia macrospinosa]
MTAIMETKDLMTPIAVIGLALKAPGDALSAEAFWDMLVKGRSAISDFPQDRINIDAFNNGKHHKVGQLPMRQGHFLKEDIRSFDAEFFNISPAEASAMDPMQRLLLETAYRGFENAGVPMQKLVGSKTSVYSGCFTTDYLLQITKDPLSIPTYGATGTGASILANRISWFFDLKGPSVNLDSACSSTGMALDLACENLRNRSTNMSLVGGCNLTFTPEYFTMLTNLSMLSKEGRSYGFDSRANGYARGEGFGVIVLKRLDDAVADGDMIRAVIRATGCNHDGRTPGITQPSSAAQQQLIKETYDKAGLSMEPVRYCETHGTGTALGDPTEAMALGRAFRKYRSCDDPLILGALKSNIGHLEGASGIAGIIKTIMVLESGCIPPNINFKTINPRIDPDYLAIKIPETPTEWPTNGLRRASVSSFGFGGSNSHIVLDDAYNYMRLRNIQGIHQTQIIPTLPKALGGISKQTNGLRNGNHHGSTVLHECCINASVPGSTRAHKPSESSIIDGHAVEYLDDDRQLPFSRVLFFSANSKQALSRMLETYRNFIDRTSTDVVSIQDLAYTLDSRRSHLPWRAHVVVTSTSDLLSVLSNCSIPSKIRHPPPRVGFVFTGQGAQWFGMGRELMMYSPFGNSVKEADKHLSSIGCSWSAQDIFTRRDPVGIDAPTMSQTLCTILQVALVDLLSYLGIKPAAVIGHSSGEIAAAYCSGAIQRKSAWEIAFYRGTFTEKVPEKCSYNGAMLAVGISEALIQPYLQQVATKNPGPWALRVACYNSPNSLTVSGVREQIESLKTILDAAEVFNRLIRVPVAYHSPQMETVAKEYLDAIGVLPASNMEVPFISSLTGKSVTSKLLRRAEYWVDNMVSPVRFAEALHLMCETSPKSLTKKLDRSHYDTSAIDMIVEIGPHAALKGPIGDVLKQVDRGSELEYASTLVRNKSAITTVQELAAQLHDRGYEVNLRRLNEHKPTLRKPLTGLPEYPFDRSQKYWHGNRMVMDYCHRKQPYQELLGAPTLDWCPLTPQWTFHIRTKELPWVEDHQIDDATLYPAAGMLVMAVEAARQMASTEGIIEGYELRNVSFSSAMSISPSLGELEVRITLRKLSQDVHLYEFSLACVNKNSEWTENSRGEVKVLMIEEVDTDSISCEIQESMHGKLDKTLDAADFYQGLREMGYGYGPTFQRIQKILFEPTFAIAQGEIEPFWSDVTENSVIHPATLDAIMHLQFVTLFKAGSERTGTYIPTGIESLWIAERGLNPSKGVLEVYSRTHDRNMRYAKGSCHVISRSKNKVLLQSSGVTLTKVAGPQLPISPHIGDRHFPMYLYTEPDVGVLDASQIQRYLDTKYDKTESPVMDRNRLREFIRATLAATQQHLQELKASPTLPHTQLYADWMDFQLGLNSFSTIQDLHTERLAVAELGAEGRLVAKVSESLIDVLLGKKAATEILFGEDQLIHNYYLEQAQTELYFQRMLSYVSLLSHKNSQLRILEVGGGTGMFTSFILNALEAKESGDSKRLRCMTYDFTDIGSGFIEAARDRFKDYDSQIQFKVLDLEANPVEQGFQAASYDLVIAISVMHATRDLKETLTNVRTLLKPGGKLILHEATTPLDPIHGFAWGIFPGWWRAIDEERRLSPIVDEQRWEELLQANGFTGLDLILPDYEDDTSRLMNFMILHAKSDGPDDAVSASCPTQQGQISVLYNANSVLQKETAEAIATYLENHEKMRCQMKTLEELLEQPNETLGPCISVLEVGQLFLAHMTKDEYYNLQKLVEGVESLLWVTHGGGDTPTDPGYHFITGFATTFRLEAAHMRLVTIGLEPKEHITDEQLQMIYRVLHASDADNYEHDYVEKNGYLHINRIIEGTQLKKDFLSRLAPSRISSPHRLDKLPAVSLCIHDPDSSRSLAFSANLEYDSPLQEGQVEIQVLAVALNQNDHNILNGRADDDGFGDHCAGLVTGVGVDVDLNIGDRVWMYSRGTCGSVARASHHSVVQLPDTVSFEQVCAVSSDYVAVCHAVDVVAKLQPRDTVLLNCAGPTLSAAIELCQKRGLSILVSCKSKTEKLTIQEHHKTVPDCTFVMSNHLRQSVTNLTRGRGVDAILSTQENDACMEVLSPWGTYIRLGQIEQSRRGHLPPNNATFINLDCAAISRMRPRILQTALLKAAQDASFINPDDVKILSASRVADAFEELRLGNDDKNVVMTFHSHDLVKIEVPRGTSYTLPEQATYVVTGPFGGFGRAIVRWLARKGAKNMILLSRSGPKNTASTALVAELHEKGVKIHCPPCDITDAEAVKSAIASKESSMPPIRGCLHLAVAGKDTILQNTTFESWQERTGAKVCGTLNLNAALPTDLDFFIMTASVGGVAGFVSMTAYSAGNSFQDGFARYLTGRGQKAVAVDFGPVQEFGMLASRENMFGRFMQSGQWVPVAEEELLAMLDYYCDSTTRIDQPYKAQPILGFQPPRRLIAQGQPVPDALQTPLWSQMHNIRHEESYTTPGSPSSVSDPLSSVGSIRDVLKSAGSKVDAHRIVTEAVLKRVSQMTSIPQERIDSSQPFHSLGIDSLTAVELRNWMAAGFGQSMAVFEILGDASVISTADWIIKKCT